MLAGVVLLKVPERDRREHASESRRLQLGMLPADRSDIDQKWVYSKMDLSLIESTHHNQQRRIACGLTSLLQP
jgi:hypothetical protein